MFNPSLFSLVGLASCLTEEDQGFLACDLISFLPICSFQSNAALCYAALSTVCGLKPIRPQGAMYLMVSCLPAVGKGRAVGVGSAFFPSPKTPQAGLFLGGEGRVFGCDHFSTPAALGGD